MDPGNTEEYIFKLSCRRNSIIKFIADQHYRDDLAAKLLQQKLINGDVDRKSRNFAPDVVETDRVAVIFDAVLAKAKANPSQLTTFLDVLKKIDADIIEGFIDRPLEVKPRVYITNVPGPDSSVVKLTCNSSAHDFPVTYEWVNLGSDTPDSQILSRDATYTALEPGTYCCTATNKFGSTTEKVKIEKSHVQPDSSNAKLHVVIETEDNQVDDLSITVPKPYGVAVKIRRQTSVTVIWKQHKVDRARGEHDQEIKEYLVQYKTKDDEWADSDPSHAKHGDDNWIHVSPGRDQDRRADIPELTPCESYDVRVYAKNSDNKWSKPSDAKKNVMTSMTTWQWIKKYPQHCFGIIIGTVTVVLLVIGIILSTVIPLTK